MDVDATSSRRIDVNTTSFWHQMPTGIVLLFVVVSEFVDEMGKSIIESHQNISFGTSTVITILTI